MKEMNVSLTKNGKRKWSTEQKVAIVNEHLSGVDVAELCRKYNIHAQMLCSGNGCWKITAKRA